CWRRWSCRRGRGMVPHLMRCSARTYLAGSVTRRVQTWSSAKHAIEGVRDMKRRRAAADEPPSLAVLEAVAPGRTRRSSRGAQTFLERRGRMVVQLTQARDGEL